MIIKKIVIFVRNISICIIILLSLIVLFKTIFLPELFDRTHYQNDYAITGVKELKMEEVLKNKIIPKGFKISPSQARLAAGRAWKLSLKHEFVCYYDNQFYYFADTFLRTYPIDWVVKYGARVDGITGEVFDPKNHKRNDVVR